MLIIRDGWGQNPHPEHDEFNAIRLAHTPVDDALRARWPWTLIRTSGPDVGLPGATMGNSEVGHQNIGAGRIVDQDSVRITKACRDGSINDNAALVPAITSARDSAHAVHLMGICSDAGVHGMIEHLVALLDLCRRLGVPGDRVRLHLFTDGRDTGPFTGTGYVRQVQDECQRIGVGRIVSVMGRYWAMDRDSRWERVARAYRCLTGRGDGPEPDLAESPAQAVQRYYDEPISQTMHGDEFITPTMIADSRDEAMATRIADGDTVIYYNYRGDRPRQLVGAFVLPDFQTSEHVNPSPDTGRQGFDRGRPLDMMFVAMASYADYLEPFVCIAFPKAPPLVNIAGEYLSNLGVTQFRCAETEKYPHVTFFFNDHREEPFPGEHRCIVQSPKVNTYDLAPEMSAPEVCRAVLDRLGADDCERFIVVNFANGDMVGHTGNLQAVIQACQTVDRCVGTIVEAALARGGSLIVTADHGNAEQMWNPRTDSPHTAHTTYTVPLHVVGEVAQGRALRDGGRLADIAPTALEMIGLDQPDEMTGQSLLA